MQQAEPPSLLRIALVFASIAAQSFGGGMLAWIRREIVVRRGWIDEGAFLTGLALCQITPGPNAVNLATFVGTALRGGKGAVAALAGMLAFPVVVVLGMGALLASARDVAALDPALTGLAAAAIGMTFANAMRMTRRAVRSPGGAAVMVATAVAVGLLGVPLVAALVVAVPLGLLVARRGW